MILERFLYISVDFALLIPVILLFTGIFGGMFYGFSRSYKSPPDKKSPLWLRCVLWTLAIAVGIILTFFLCVFLIWNPVAANGIILIVCIAVPVLLIAAGIHAVKVLKTGSVKKPLAILSICLAAVVLADTAVFFISRRPDNVYDEIYYAMRDVDFPGDSKLPRSGYFELSYPDDIFGTTARDSRNTSDGSFDTIELFCGESARVYCIFETKELVFYNEPIRDVSWSMYVYDVRSNELSYSSSRGSSYERDPFLDDIVTHWYAYLGHESKFRAWDSGDYTDIGYREADGYIHEIVRW